MARPNWCALALVAVLSGCTRLTSEQQLIADAARALGGESRIRAARTLLLEGEGSNFNLGQDMRPDAATQTFTVSGYRRVVDLAGIRMKVEQTRTPNFAYFQGQQAQRQVVGIDGDVAYNVGAKRRTLGAKNPHVPGDVVGWLGPRRLGRHGPCSERTGFAPRHLGDSARAVRGLSARQGVLADTSSLALVELPPGMKQAHQHHNQEQVTLGVGGALGLSIGGVAHLLGAHGAGLTLG